MEQLVRYSLWLTAPFNLVAGVAFARPDSALASLLTLPSDVPAFYALFSGGMIFLFGLVYAWLAMQKTIVPSLLCVGTCGKLMAVSIAVGLYAVGGVSGIFALVILGDLLFVGLWFTYLTSSKEALDV